MVLGDIFILWVLLSPFLFVMLVLSLSIALILYHDGIATMLETLLKALGIRRWHTHFNLDQRMSDHIAGMHMIIEFYHPNPSVNLLRAINLHDVHELEFGDMPFSAKTPELKALEDAFQADFCARHGINYPNLTVEEFLWLKFADQMDAANFLARQDNLTDDQLRIMQEAAEQAQFYAQQLQAFGYFTEAGNSVH